ncbi:MAG TPA: DMT family transporter [Cyclobacteriaceae bacterium]|nr:DMT family transporter [Cyclobacteriaceae bacterium]
MSDNSRFTAVFLLIVLALIWGTSFILMKRGLLVFSPDEVGALRVTAACVVLLPFAFSNLKSLPKEQYWKPFTYGMLGIFIPAFLFATAQTRMESSIAGVLNSLTPIFTLIVGVIVFKQKFKPIAAIGLLLSLVGTMLLIMARSGGQLGGVNYFALLILVACICYGCAANFLKFQLSGLSSMTITSLALLFIGPLAITYLFIFTDFATNLAEVPGAWAACGYIVLLGIMSTSVATLLFTKLIKMSSPIFASSVTYLIPIVAVMWGVFDGEHLYAGHYAGMATIIGGVYLANRK